MQDEVQDCRWPLVHSDATGQWPLDTSVNNRSFSYPALGQMMPEPPVMVQDWCDCQPVCTMLEIELQAARATADAAAALEAAEAP